MRIGILTTSRADFGILDSLINEFKKYPLEFELILFASGSHYDENLGSTILEVRKCFAGRLVELPVAPRRLEGEEIPKRAFEVGSLLADAISKNPVDLTFLLGDRYETLTCALAFFLLNIPIAHLCGGDISEGAQDDSIRHAISKLSHLHFPNNEDSRKRIIQMGENPEHVFNVGSLSIDNILNMDFLKKKDLEKELGFEIGRSLILLTVHPETLGCVTIEEVIENFKEVFQKFDRCQFVITGSNADSGGEKINSLFREIARERENVYFYKSLGWKKYFSLLKFTNTVVGNSSSGLSEVPSFGIPSINLGERQRGRLSSKGTIHAEFKTASIIQAIEMSFCTEKRTIAKNCENPYGNGGTAEKIIQIIKDNLSRSLINKRFFKIG